MNEVESSTESVCIVIQIETLQWPSFNTHVRNIFICKIENIIN